MSTSFITSSRILSSDLFDGRLEKFGVREFISEHTNPDSVRLLTDGRNCLFVYIDEDGFVTCFVRYGANAPGRIVDAVAEAFDTDIFSEYEPQYWGYDTNEEWDQAMKKYAEEHEVEFYEDIMRYLQGEKHDIREGTNGESMAKIAKKLVAEKSELKLPENKQELMDSIKLIYERDHMITINLTDTDIAYAQMIATHEDDLSQA